MKESNKMNVTKTYLTVLVLTGFTQQEGVTIIGLLKEKYPSIEWGKLWDHAPIAKNRAFSMLESLGNLIEEYCDSHNIDSTYKLKAYEDIKTKILKKIVG